MCIKNILPFNIRKTTMQSLVLSKLFYNDCALYPISLGLLKQMQKIQKAAATFVYGRNASIEDVIKLNWLPAKHYMAQTGRSTWTLKGSSMKEHCDQVQDYC